VPCPRLVHVRAASAAALNRVRLRLGNVPEGELEVHERVPGVRDSFSPAGGSRREDLAAQLCGAKGMKGAPNPCGC
jgi:hypothetical protein